MNASLPRPEKVVLVERVAARHGLDVGLVMSDYRFAFVRGFRRSKPVLSSGLLCALTAEEPAVVLEHEAARHGRRDNLVKLAPSACSYASAAFPLSRLILRWRALQVEMVYDDVADKIVETIVRAASSATRGRPLPHQGGQGDRKRRPRRRRLPRPRGPRSVR